jgi:hypothetical protein
MIHQLHSITYTCSHYQRVLTNADRIIKIKNMESVNVGTERINNVVSTSEVI